MNLLATLGLAAIAVYCTTAASAAPTYHLTREVNLAGDEGWDFLEVDTAAGRLYITHGSKVQVLKLDDLSLVGEIGDTPGVHGVALASDLGHGYISAGRADSIVVFDLKTLARVQEIKTTGANPDAILYDPPTRQVFSFNGRGRNVTVISAANNAVIATIALDAKPEVAVTDLAGHVFVNLEDKNSIAVIDTKARVVQRTWPIAGCEGPTGLAIDRRQGRLFAVCSNQVMAMVNAKSGSVIATLPIGARVDGVAFDPTTRLIFATCGDGTLTVAHEDSPETFAVVQTPQTRAGARTVALDEKTHRVYTATAQFGENTDPAGPRRRILPGTFSVLALGP
jgi:DNA-binding beta-propeller fold protein YncE